MQASEALEFEQAARLRDLISSLQHADPAGVDGRAADLDVLAVAMQGSQACVLLLAFRDGRNLPVLPRTNGEESPEEVLAAFVSQYYIEFEPPREILLDREFPTPTCWSPRSARPSARCS